MTGLELEKSRTALLSSGQLYDILGIVGTEIGNGW